MSELQRYFLAQQGNESERVRKMTLLEAYYANEQYKCLPRAWDETLDSSGCMIPFRLRRPSCVVPLPSLVVDTFVRSLWAEGRRPVATVKGEEDTLGDNKLLASLTHQAKLYRTIREATRCALVTGTGCVVWRYVDGEYIADSWNPKHCTPTFTPGRFPQLESLEICFPFSTEVAGHQVTKWHREVIDSSTWTVYKDAIVSADREPTWSKDTALSAQHGLGFVPAVWFTVGQRSGSWDGTGIYSAILGLFDDLNYTASQQGRALYYNLDPQTVFSGVSDIDVESLKKGGANSWSLPSGGDAKLLESTGEFIKTSETRLDYLRKQVMDYCAVVIPDPERVKGAQSGASLELLSAPMAARISELREDVGDGAFRHLLEQMMRHQTGNARSVALTWGALLPVTSDDSRLAVVAATGALQAGLISRAAGSRYVAPFLGVADPESDQLAARDEKDREREVALAVSLNGADVPSQTFQREHKTKLAMHVLGKDAAPGMEDQIRQELAKNLYPDGWIDDTRMTPAHPRDMSTNTTEEEDENDR